MAQHSWYSDYISSLITLDSDSSETYETLQFLRLQLATEPNVFQELLLHRTIPRLESEEELLELLVLVSNAGWSSYAPRIIARLVGLDRVRSQYPEYGEYIDRALQLEVVSAPYLVKDWHILSNHIAIPHDKRSSWSRRMIDVETIVSVQPAEEFSNHYVEEILSYVYAANVRLFQLAIAAFTTQNPQWSNVLHHVLSAPYINVRVAPARGLDTREQPLCAGSWAPNWCLFMDGVRRNNWRIYERSTQVELPGQGDKGLLEQITILLSLSGLLRDGIMLTPIKTRPLAARNSQPIWGFKDKQFVAGGTGYHAHEVRALALAFLERLPATSRVSAFRSRLAMYFLSVDAKRRRSASALTLDNGFFALVIDIARLFSRNAFSSVMKEIDCSLFASEPILNYFFEESAAATALISGSSDIVTGQGRSEAAYPDRILCVAHASLPHQSGGYAVRAHGILKHLKEQNVDISAVTRPGFPDGIHTESTIDIVDGVEYLRLPSTRVPREDGEIQHMLSFVEPFEKLFEDARVGKIHLRSTYFIALPAYIAARRLGLRVVYEISGLWDLVYQDGEVQTQILQRASFAMLAESTVMSHADQVVVMNESVREIALARGTHKSRISIAPNAVDIDEFRPLDEPDSKTFTVGYMGSFVSYEGLGRLVNAAKILKQWGTPVRFLAVGDGIRWAPLVKQIENEGLSDIFQLPGRVPHDEVIDYYRQMDAMVYPRISTGTTEAITPLKPFEALALAKPIIVSDVAPLREIVGDDERGLVFEGGSAEGLALAIQQLIESPRLRREIGYAGRRWVVEHRNWENVVNVFTDVYSRLN